MQITFDIIKLKFERANIQSESYSFDEYKADALCVQQTENGEWEIFEGERFGRKFNRHTFQNEKEACTYFLNRARELKIVSKSDGIPLPVLVKDLDFRDRTPRFIDVVALKNNGKLCQWSPHEQSYFYKVDEELIADVEKIVRCEYCKHKRVSGIGTPFCVHPEGLKKITKDTYCCHGEEN